MGKLTSSILVSFILFAQAVNADLISDLDNLVESKHNAKNFDGNVLIKINGETIFQKSIGFANAEWEVGHTNESRFMIASLTKQFTAYAVLLLAKEGRVSLSDSISKYIELPKNSPIDSGYWQKITVQNLLTHTAGLIRDVPRTPNMSTSDYNLPSTILLNVLQSKDVKYKAVGEFSYSNLGYLILAILIEEVALSSFDNYMMKAIFSPLKMWNTGTYHRGKFIKNMAEGYFYNDMMRLSKRCCHDASVFTGSHHLYSNGEDISSWLEEIREPSGKLDEEVVNKLKTSQVLAMADKEGNEKYYGYGLFFGQFAGMNRISHNGHEWGYNSAITIIEEMNLTVVVLANRHNLNLFSEQSDVDDLVDEIVLRIKKEDQ